MATISEALAIALQHHQAGRLQAADQIYRQILEAKPIQADAIHLLGVIALQLGKNEVAVECIARAIELRGNAASFHYNLATAYLALGRFSDAIASNRRALELKPDYAEAHNNLGNALQALGSLAEAVTCYQRATELKPDFIEAQLNLGNALKDLGKTVEAVACYQRALEVGPDSAAAQLNLGNALKDLGKMAEAVACYQRALEANPGFAPAHNNLGNAFMEQGSLEDAVECFHRALAIAPDYAEAHGNLANTFREQGKLEDAIACGRRALALKPDFAGASDNLSSALLLLGRYEEGWTAYESRLALFPPREFSAPRWNREPAEGQTIFLHSEQGFGDTLLFARYAATVRECAKAGRVILECQPSLARLLACSSRGEIEIIARSESEAATPAHHYHLPLLSSPFALGIHEPLHASKPYLQADPELCAIWRERLGPAGRLRVGLAWQGNPEQARDRFRSIPAERFLPLLETEGVEFYSLQIEEGGAGSSALTEAGLIELSENIHDFADTAALMNALDLVIAVDTAVVHLAGGLGRPVWTLLPFMPHWPWKTEGESTPWYPTMRLFRQAERGNWDSVLLRVGEELGALLSGRKEGSLQ